MITVSTDEIADYGGIDGQMAVNHSETYMIGDVHVNMFENRRDFLRQWLRKFRGISKHYLQGYLDFLCLQLKTAEELVQDVVGDDSSV